MSVGQDVADLDQQSGSVTLGLLEALEVLRLRTLPIEATACWKWHCCQPCRTTRSGLDFFSACVCLFDGYDWPAYIDVQR